MTNEFTREARYAVLKSAEIGRPPLGCVVVESDWPEYEPTWRAIEARATGAEQPTSHAFDDSATIAGLESAVSHLSACLDEFRALLVEVNDVCGRDGYGGPLEEGESEIIDKVRAALSMTEPAPRSKPES